MKRALVIACLSTALLLPASAEAAKMRFGGKSDGTSSSKPSAETSASGGTSRSLVVVPGITAGKAKAGEQTPTRVPFPPATTAQAEPAPTLMKLTVNDGAKIWCRSEVVVGGFCVLN
ncbi:MAG TPA: hypothetical protein VIU82_01475 [Bosea sp. (in: a-proteobacteria)]